VGEKNPRRHGGTIADSSASGRSWLGFRNEGTVRELVARDPSFDALCHEYRKVIELVGSSKTHVELLKERRALLEEKLLTGI
jgi:hypothetical protein